jgi:hypothetical protein
MALPSFVSVAEHFIYVPIPSVQRQRAAHISRRSGQLQGWVRQNVFRRSANVSVFCLTHRVTKVKQFKLFHDTLHLFRVTHAIYMAMSLSNRDRAMSIRTNCSECGRHTGYPH